MICVMFKVYFTKYICTVFTLVQSRSEPLLFSVCATPRNCTFCTKLINLPEKDDKRQYRQHKWKVFSCPKSNSLRNQKLISDRTEINLHKSQKYSATSVFLFSWLFEGEWPRTNVGSDGRRRHGPCLIPV